MVFDLILTFRTLLEMWLQTLFILPFRNAEMLWLLVPVWVAWFFSEFFQEKIGTSFGNAITNAVVILWGSIDCTRQTLKLIAEKSISSTWQIAGRFTLIGFVFVYGIIIVHLGFKGNKIIKSIGRVRNVTYVFAMFVPVFYNAIPLSIEHFLAAILFFPVYYFAIELLDRITPDPKALVEDMGVAEKTKNSYPLDNRDNSKNIPINYVASTYPRNNRENFNTKIRHDADNQWTRRY